MIDIFAATKLGNLKPNIAVARAVQSNIDPIVNLNRKQLNQGKKSDGSSTGSYSNIKYKGFLRPVNLYLTGDWRREITLDIGAYQFTIINPEEKTVYLQRRYGDTILGLTKQSEATASRFILPDLIKELNKQLGI